jgi:hypothetical protein
MRHQTRDGWPCTFSLYPDFLNYYTADTKRDANGFSLNFLEDELARAQEDRFVGIDETCQGSSSQNKMRQEGDKRMHPLAHFLQAMNWRKEVNLEEWFQEWEDQRYQRESGFGYDFAGPTADRDDCGTDPTEGTAVSLNEVSNLITTEHLPRDASPLTTTHTNGNGTSTFLNSDRLHIDL